MIRRSSAAYLLAAGLLFGMAFGTAPASAQSVAKFYSGKVVTIVIPFGPGGGYHLYSNLTAKHIKQYVPGTPSIVLQFMPGAGGLKGANYFYHAASKTGTQIALLSQTAALFQRLNKGSKNFRYDAAKLQYIGRLVTMDAAHMFFKSIPDRNLGKLKGTKGKIIACTAGKAAQGYINAKALSVASGIGIKILTGYQGSRRQNLAMEQGECNYQPGAWNSWKARRQDWIKSKTILPVALTAPERHPDLPNVPTIVELAGPKHKDIMSFIAGYAAVGRAFSFPPGVPKARVKALRTAFNKMVKNPDFLAQAKKTNMLLGTATGETVQKAVDGIIGASDELVARTKKMLGYK